MYNLDLDTTALLSLAFNFFPVATRSNAANNSTAAQNHFSPYTIIK